MRRLRKQNANSVEFWDKHWAATPPWRIGIDVLTDRWEAMEKYIAPDDKVLDIGGGRGEIATWLETHAGCHCKVADFAPSAILKARECGIAAVQWDACGEVPDCWMGAFDVVCATEIIEHIESPALLLSNMSKICKSGGSLIVTTPHGNAYPEDAHHVWAFTRDDLTELMGKYGPVEFTCVTRGIVAHCKNR